MNYGDKHMLIEMRQHSCLGPCDREHEFMSHATRITYMGEIWGSMGHGIEIILIQIDDFVDLDYINPYIPSDGNSRIHGL